MIHCLTEAVGRLVCSVYNLYNVAEGWSKVHKYQSGVPHGKCLYHGVCVWFTSSHLVSQFHVCLVV